MCLKVDEWSCKMYIEVVNLPKFAAKKSTKSAFRFVNLRPQPSGTSLLPLQLRMYSKYRVWSEKPCLINWLIVQKSFKLLLDSFVGVLFVQRTPVYRYMYACSLSAKYALQYIVQYVVLIRYLSSSLHNLLLLNKEAHSTCAYDNVTLYAEHCSVIVRCVTRLPAKSRQSFANLSIKSIVATKKLIPCNCDRVRILSRDSFVCAKLCLLPEPVGRSEASARNASEVFAPGFVQCELVLSALRQKARHLWLKVVAVSGRIGVVGLARSLKLD